MVASRPSAQLERTIHYPQNAQGLASLSWPLGGDRLRDRDEAEGPVVEAVLAVKKSGIVAGVRRRPLSQASQRARSIHVTEPRATRDGAGIGGSRISTSVSVHAQYSL